MMRGFIQSSRMYLHYCMYFKYCLVTTIALFISGCQMFQSEPARVADPALLESLRPADIQPATLNNYTQSDVDLEDVIANYSELLPLLESPEDQLTVLHRLADLKLLKGEEIMAEQAIDELDIAIDAYKGLLQRYPDREVNDRVYYQLAKTYDLKGEVDNYLSTLTILVGTFPKSKYTAEAQFRRGEILFSAEDYVGAEQAFEATVAVGNSSFLANAHYMKGWSEFKQTRYNDALLSFVDVLDLVMPDSLKVGEVEQRSQTMVEDLFRVMGLSLSYLGGADALENLFNVAGHRSYEIVVYDRYSDLLISKEQYSDALSVYRRFITLHPLNLNAPRYQANIIGTLEKAGFKAEIFEEKVRFVDVYGIGSAFWLVNKDQDLEPVFTELKILLPELADRHYVLAQRAEKQNQKQARASNYRKAARYYGDFVVAFPSERQTPETLMLLGECRLALENWASAIYAFEAAGYYFPSYDKANEAAYASILAYNGFSRSWDANNPRVLTANKDLRQKSRLRFVDEFSTDRRADDVLYSATQDAFAEQDYVQSIELTERLLDWQPSPSNKVLAETRIIKAHSLYALKDYKYAELAYVAAINGLPRSDQRRIALNENLAASVYRQAELLLGAGETLAAIDELLRVGVASPSSTLRTNAEYDAIAYLIELKKWPRAITEMRTFRSRYPQHALIDTLVPKMALAYRETRQWELAADELKTMILLAKTDQEKQDTLYIAAELYDRADNKAKAISNYRSYANTYPNPPSEYMEAANRLAELYDETGDQIKRRFWLAKQMKTVDALGSDADQRMVYLAASASAVLANDAFTRYARIKLKLPLNESMAKKTIALERAMQAYQKTASYGISSFSTEAGYRMADIYVQLSQDLMNSDRPKGLNELELEQYEILLEEQAFPFEDSAIDIHEQNASRSWNGIYDDWVKESFASLRKLLPGRYDKPELTGGLVDALQ
ncbi:hypothetical protein A3742_06805 [Oleiphilus sp. HI0071]|nr:hypothetical protein A3737_09635 [Oleiphilus sp. HI0065]KZY83555.1 hypothetical protein A3742_06805 [Oleiphilus sp. HI0071]KZY97815.1 hypothetical protein A3744_01145 [Oleiphilus sp. HI0073]KZZ09792.1 hypothetical protein A3750_08580 [Oleiphilus sp. HI0079]KZZ13328.1 hypothetical protein A3751_04950 [Oleiphilus sp. HI0080]KZZ52292.1 hypothetical protein A3760_00925 [Oleiphilus sp. HI0122]KZZ74348.1 hypothetical protein A3765_11640 [Oleiphilus sp. HI0130]KZZ77661.1 hypothetical protein A37